MFPSAAQPASTIGAGVTGIFNDPGRVASGPGGVVLAFLALLGRTFSGRACVGGFGVGFDPVWRGRRRLLAGPAGGTSPLLLERLQFFLEGYSVGWDPDDLTLT